MLTLEHVKQNATSGALTGVLVLLCIQGKVSIGNALLLKGLWIAWMVALRNGAVVLEHPAMPWEEFKPSIWRTALILLLVRRPGHLFSKLTIEQWRFGSCGIKPTTLLFANTNLGMEMTSGEIAGLSRPTNPLIGRNSKGEYKTSSAKEYPSALNRALACALLQGLHRFPPFAEEDIDIEPLGSEFAQQAASSENSHIMPDYQLL
eukprot:s3609_g3.t1